MVIEVANTGHKSSSGGFEPAHVKVQIKDAGNNVIHNAKYFLEEDIYRIIGK
ncbi:hypothetical protein YD04_004518 [Salmonella enterica subsp. enterica]|nr:hypothetical protein [Salmonella enterica subsp. enterica]